MDKGLLTDGDSTVVARCMRRGFLETLADACLLGSVEGTMTMGWMASHGITGLEGVEDISGLASGRGEGFLPKHIYSADVLVYRIRRRKRDGFIWERRLGIVIN
jgi:hypothetical protein